MIKQHEIHAILNDYPNLHYSGFVTPGSKAAKSKDYFYHCREKLLSSSCEIMREFDRACDWLFFIDTIKTINPRSSSYSLKHMAEQYSDGYISNGSFILTALHLGFDLKRTKGTPNACFNMSQRSINRALPEGY